MKINIPLEHFVRTFNVAFDKNLSNSYEVEMCIKGGANSQGDMMLISYICVKFIYNVQRTIKIVLIDLQQDMQHLLRNMLKDIRVR